MKEEGSYLSLLKIKGFVAFLTTQFLGALNDNIYKFLVSIVAIDLVLEDPSTPYEFIVAMVFVVPFLLFSGYAGYLADRYAKRKVLVIVKSFEIVSMLLAFFVLPQANIWLLSSVLFLMASQSAFFGPAKYGILPEWLDGADLSRANGLIQLTTFVAIILGSVLGGIVKTIFWESQPHTIGIILIAIAIVGTLAAMRIPHSGHDGQKENRFSINPYSEIITGVKSLRQNKVLWLTVLGISYFWFLGAIIERDLLLFAKQLMQLDDLRTGLLPAFLAIGIGLGSFAAGSLSGDKVELGLVPLGGLGLCVTSFMFGNSHESFLMACITLTALGWFGGFFVVPLNALLQQKSGSDEKGRIMATNNFLTMVGVVFGLMIYAVARTYLHAEADTIIFIAGIGTLIATLYLMTTLPEFLVRFVLWMITHSIYRIHIHGRPNIPARGPALIVANHLSYVDGLLVAACVQRFVRFMVFRKIWEMPIFNWIFRLAKAIPVQGGDAEKVAESINAAKAELEAGHAVCIFAEGRISRTGNMLPFRSGLERIAKDTGAPIIPVHIDGIWGSFFSFRKGRKAKIRLPRIGARVVNVSFGDPLPTDASAWEVRQAVQSLGSEAATARVKEDATFFQAFIETAKQQRRKELFINADTGEKASWLDALTVAWAGAQYLNRHARQHDRIAIALPDRLHTALAFLAVTASGRTACILPAHASSDTFRKTLFRLQIGAVITDRADVQGSQITCISWNNLYRTKHRAEVNLPQLLFFPSRWNARSLSKTAPSCTAPALILTRDKKTNPAGDIVLSHRALLATLEAVGQVFHLQKSDRILGVLQLHHAFGFMLNIALPAVAGCGIVLHRETDDIATLDKVLVGQRPTILINDNLCYQRYLTQLRPDALSRIRLAIANDVSLSKEFLRDFQEKFSLELLNGFGRAEMSSVISVNAMDVRSAGQLQRGKKWGSVGHPLPSIAVRVINPDTGELCAPEVEGILEVKGPGVMSGYLVDGKISHVVDPSDWFNTQQKALLDEDGFIHLLND